MRHDHFLWRKRAQTNMSYSNEVPSQSMYDHMVGRARSITSLLYSILLDVYKYSIIYIKARNQEYRVKRSERGGGMQKDRTPCKENFQKFGIISSNFMFYRKFSNLSTTLVIRLELYITVKIQFSLNLLICMAQKNLQNLVFSSNFTRLDTRKC